MAEAVGSIKMLLPCPIMSGAKREDTDVVSKIRVGMEGIFMPYICHDDNYIERNGVMFFKSEIADCSLGDGMRHEFLAAEQGLVFDRNSYRGAAGAQTLDDIEEYVIKNLNKN